MARREARPRRREFFPVWYGGGGTTTPAPVITSSLTASGTVGVAFSYTITATNSPTSYNATGLPAGLSINTGTGAITGTPSAAATTNVTISATNAGGSDSKTLVLTVSAGAAVLSAASAAAYSDIFVWLQVTTDTASGTLYAVVCPAAATAPSGAQIAAGQDGSGAAATAAANAAMSSSGVKQLLLRGLTGGTAYKVYATHQTAGPTYSNVVNAAFTTDVLIFSAANTGAATGLTASTGSAALGLNQADPYGGTTALRWTDSNDSVSGVVLLASTSQTFFNGVNKVFLTAKNQGAGNGIWERISFNSITVSATATTHWNTSTGAVGTTLAAWTTTPVVFSVGSSWQMFTGQVNLAGADVVGLLNINKGAADNATTVTRNGTHITDIYDIRITRAGP